MTTRSTTRTPTALIGAAAVALLALVGTACSDDGDEAEPTIDTSVPEVDGAADDVVDGTEAGYETDDLNVPGTETDDEVDQAEDN